MNLFKRSGTVTLDFSWLCAFFHVLPEPSRVLKKSDWRNASTHLCCIFFRLNIPCIFVCYLYITVCISLANDDSSRLCKNYAHMLFLCTSPIIGGFRYRKKGGIVDIPLSVPWHRLRPMDDKYYCSRFITFHSLFKEILHPSGLDSSCKQRFILHFCTPIFNDLYPPMIFEFSKVTYMCG